MDPTFALTSVSLAALAASLPRLHRRLMLSRAKHRSLAGHSRLAKRIAGLTDGKFIATVFIKCAGGGSVG